MSYKYFLLENGDIIQNCKNITIADNLPIVDDDGNFTGFSQVVAHSNSKEELLRMRNLMANPPKIEVMEVKLVETKKIELLERFFFMVMNKGKFMTSDLEHEVYDVNLEYSWLVDELRRLLKDE